MPTVVRILIFGVERTRAHNCELNYSVNVALASSTVAIIENNPVCERIVDRVINLLKRRLFNTFYG